MSFLAPLFFIAGAAIAAPIIFHLIRREPKGRIEFSSLMFIKPSPPRVTRRSRIDHWLLLLLRALAVLLVAAAFTRPFLRTFAETTTRKASGITVILVDQSASMKREDLWSQAVAAVNDQLNQLGPFDRYAVATFDHRVRRLSELQLKTEANPQSILKELRAQQPSWHRSDLGAAIVEAIEWLDETMREADEADTERTIVVVSDMQQSSKLDALRGMSWPKSTRLRSVPVAVKSPSNGSLFVSSQALSGSDAGQPVVSGGTDNEDGSERFYRVKLTNAAASGVGRFELDWMDQAGQKLERSSGEIYSVNVPPGSEKIVHLKAPTNNAVGLSVSGDDHPYDNLHFVIVPELLEQRVLMLGSPKEDPRESLYYYLEKLPLGGPGRNVKTQLVSPAEFSAAIAESELAPEQVPLIVVSEFPDSAEIDRLGRFMAQGGRVLVVVDQTAAENQATQSALRQLSGDESLSVAGAVVKDYSLFSRIDFGSEVFRALADPRYSDFTKVQFWKHAELRVGADAQPTETNPGDAAQAVNEPKDAVTNDWNVLAHFDRGAPALLKKQVGEGNLFVLAAGWQPAESQLALSTKFVPLLSGFLGETRRGAAWTSVVVGDRMEFPVSENAELVLADGTVIAYRDSTDADRIDQPGIYLWREREQQRRFAVNLSTAESDFELMERSMLEQLGVEFEDQKKQSVLEAGERQKRDSELEKQQSIWRWLLVSALGLIGVETLLSTRRRLASATPTP